MPVSKLSTQQNIHHSIICQAFEQSCMLMQEYVGQEGQQRLLRSHRRAARRSETRSKKQQTKRRGRRQTGRAQAGASAQGGRTLDKYAWLQVRIPLFLPGATPALTPHVDVCVCVSTARLALAEALPPSGIKQRLKIYVAFVVRMLLSLHGRQEKLGLRRSFAHLLSTGLSHIAYSITIRAAMLYHPCMFLHWTRPTACAECFHVSLCLCCV